MSSADHYLADVLKSLAQPTRLKIIDFLRTGERCVCEIFPAIEEEQSNTSRHLTYIRSSFPPEKTKRLLFRKREYIGNVLAALLGIVTPFCSCSAVPLFTGFVEGFVKARGLANFSLLSRRLGGLVVALVGGWFVWQSLL